MKLSFNELLQGHSVYNKSSFSLVFGTTDFNKPHHTVEISEENIFVHPDYDSRKFENDIAVISLPTMLEFDQKMNKIDMADENYIPKEGDSVTIFGFTKSYHSSPLIFYSNLRSINSTVANFSTCRSSYYKKNLLYWLKQERQFCVSLRDGKCLTNKGS